LGISSRKGPPLPRVKGITREAKSFTHQVLDLILRHSYGVNLPYLFRIYLEKILNLNYDDVLKDKRLYNRYYKRLYRLISSLAREGYVKVYLADSLVWIKPSPKLVDLIVSKKAKFKPMESPRGFDRSKSNSERIHPLRLGAIEFLKNRHFLNEEGWFNLYSYFEKYLDDVSDRVLIFEHRYYDDEYLALPYKHRFLETEIKKKIREFNEMWNSVDEKIGVFITLTLDPSTYDNLYEACVKLSEAFNRFMSFLSRRAGRRLKYIKVLEPQDRGNPHLHVVIFGISRIEDHFKLTEILRGQGFGMIHFEYKIIKDRGRWLWASSRPKDSDNYDVKAYITKYLLKILRGKSNDKIATYKIAFYFATNRRFFTYSRSLLIKKEKEDREEWVFLGSFYYYNIPDFILEIIDVFAVMPRKFS